MCSVFQWTVTLGASLSVALLRALFLTYTQRERKQERLRIFMLNVNFILFLFCFVFPVKMTEFVWNYSAIKNKRKPLSVPLVVGGTILSKWQSHWLELTYYGPHFDFSKSVQENAANVIIIHEPNNLSDLSAFYIISSIISI